MAGENDKLTAEQIARLAAEVGLGQAASRALQGVVNKTQAYEMNQQRMQSIAADPTYAAFTTGIGGRPPLSVSDPNNSQLVDRYHRLEEMMTRAANVNSTIDEKARQRAMEAVGHDIKSRMSESAVNGETLRMMESPSIQQAGYRMASQMAPHLIQRSISSLSGNINAIREGAFGEIPSLFDPTGQINVETMASIGGAFHSVRTNTAELAKYKAAYRHIRSQGLDPESQFQEAASEAGRAEGILLRNKVSKNIEQNAYGSAEDLTKREIQIAERLLKIKKELVEVTEEESEKAEKLFAERRKLSEELTEVGEARRQQGGGGGQGRFGALRKYGPLIDAAELIPQGIRTANNVALTDVNLQRSAADWENTKYGLYTRAAKGDMAALSAMESFSTAEQFGNLLGAGERASSVFDVLLSAGRGALYGAGTGAVAGALGGPIGAGGGAIIGGIGGALSGIGNAVFGQSAAGINLQGRHAVLDAQMALASISSQQRQGFYNFSTGLAVAGRNMGGSAREAMIQGLTSTQGLDMMSNLGITPDQMIAYQSFGAQTIGNTFSTNQVALSRRLERAGLGDVQQNLMRIGGFAEAGANNPQKALETTMSYALSSAIENSKVLNAVAQNTAGLSYAGAALGIDTTAAAARGITLGVRQDQNQGFMVSQNAMMQQTLASRMTDINVGLTPGIGLAATTRALGRAGIGSINAPLVQMLDPATLQTLMQTAETGDAYTLSTQLAQGHLGFMSNRAFTPEGRKQIKDILGAQANYRVGNLIGGETNMALGVSGMKGYDTLIKNITAGKYSVEQLETAAFGNVTPEGMSAEEAAVFARSFQGAAMRGMKVSPRVFAAGAVSLGRGGKVPPEAQALMKQLETQQKTGQQLEGVLSTDAKQQVEAMKVAIDGMGGSAGNAVEAINKLSVAFDAIARNAPAVERAAKDAAKRASEDLRQVVDYSKMTPYESFMVGGIPGMMQSFQSSKK
jgi:hypothetical protein